MNKIDKKIVEEVNALTILMEKNNLSELEISDGKRSYKLKKNYQNSKENNLKTNFEKTEEKKK